MHALFLCNNIFGYLDDTILIQMSFMFQLALLNFGFKLLMKHFSLDRRKVLLSKTSYKMKKILYLEFK